MKKESVLTIFLSVALSVAASIACSYYIVNNTELGVVENTPVAEVTDNTTGEVKTYVAGGEAIIRTTSGEEIPVKIADDQYLISEDYLSILAKGFGTTETIKADNLVITGNKPSVTQSLTSVNAATFNDIFEIYCQIYGEEFRSEGVEGIWSPAYTLMHTGSLPEDLPDNYTVEEYGEITHNDITWKFYEVNYETDETIYTDAAGNELPEEEVVPNIVHTQFLVAYSDTEDPVEVMCYEENNNTDNQYKMILDFLKVE